MPNLSVWLEAYATIRVLFSHTLFCAPAKSLHAPSIVHVNAHYGIVELSERLGEDAIGLMKGLSLETVVR